MPKVLDTLRYQLRRVVQTQRAFDNWYAILLAIALNAFHRGPDILTFRVRSGTELVCPNVRGARLAIYEQYADDTYDLAWFVGPLADKAVKAIDVGAHVGAFAVNLATQLPDAEVAAYEPSPDTARFLRANLTRNGLIARTTVSELALSGTTGWAMLDDNGAGSVHNGLIRETERLVSGDDSAGDRHVVRVQTTTFDHAVAKIGGAVHVVKLDCEGAEYDLVRNSSPASWTAVQRVVLEYHPVAGESWELLSAMFAEMGLRVVRHVPNSNGLGKAWLARDEHQVRGATA